RHGDQGDAGQGALRVRGDDAVRLARSTVSGGAVEPGAGVAPRRAEGLWGRLYRVRGAERARGAGAQELTKRQAATLRTAKVRERSSRAHPPRLQTRGHQMTAPSRSRYGRSELLATVTSRTDRAWR